MISVRARRSLPEKVAESVSESVGAVPVTVLCSEEVGSLSVQRRKKLQKAHEIYASRIAAGLRVKPNGYAKYIDVDLGFKTT